jgi:hypothetical protein
MAKNTARRAKPEVLAADLPMETKPTACGELFERFLNEKDIRMAGIWFWRNGVSEEEDGAFDSIRFSVDNLFSGSMALTIASPSAKDSSRPGRPISGQFPVNRVYSGTGCFRYA